MTIFSMDNMTTTTNRNTVSWKFVRVGFQFRLNIPLIEYSRTIYGVYRYRNSFSNMKFSNIHQHRISSVKMVNATVLPTSNFDPRTVPYVSTTAKLNMDATLLHAANIAIPLHTRSRTTQISQLKPSLTMSSPKLLSRRKIEIKQIYSVQDIRLTKMMATSMYCLSQISSQLMLQINENPKTIYTIGGNNGYLL